jgi:hypothetical protein
MTSPFVQDGLVSRPPVSEGRPLLQIFSDSCAQVVVKGDPESRHVDTGERRDRVSRLTFFAGRQRAALRLIKGQGYPPCQAAKALETATTGVRLQVSADQVRAAVPDPGAVKVVVVGDLASLKEPLAGLGWGPST